MGTLLATEGSETLAVLAVCVGAALLLAVEALGIIAVLLVAGGGAGQYPLAHRILAPLKTSTGQCKAYNSYSNAVTCSFHDNVSLLGVSKCMTL